MGGDDGTTRAPTQNPEYVRVAAETITVHVSRMGGAFGRRFYADFAAEAIYLSRAVGAPVQVVWSRDDDVQHGFYRPAGYHVLRAGLDANGRLTSWEHRLFNASRGDYMQWTPPPDRPFNPGEMSSDDYQVPFSPAFRYSYSHADSPIPRGQWRAVENSSNVLVSQSMMDELAHAAGRDPLEFQIEALREAGANSTPRALRRRAPDPRPADGGA